MKVLQMRKSAPMKPVDTGALPIDSKISELKALDNVTLNEILELEADGVRPTVAESATDRVDELLGDVIKRPVADQRSKRLADLYDLRDDIARALDLARQQQIRDHGDRVRERAVEEMPAWIELTREAVLTAAKLQRLNRERRDFMTRFRNPAGLRPTMPCQGEAPLGLGTNGDPAYQFVEAALKAGIITRKEVENA